MARPMDHPTHPLPLQIYLQPSGHVACNWFRLAARRAPAPVPRGYEQGVAGVAGRSPGDATPTGGQASRQPAGGSCDCLSARVSFNDISQVGGVGETSEHSDPIQTAPPAPPQPPSTTVTQSITGTRSLAFHTQSNMCTSRPVEQVSCCTSRERTRVPRSTARCIWPPSRPVQGERGGAGRGGSSSLPKIFTAPLHAWLQPWLSCVPCQRTAPSHTTVGAQVLDQAG